VVLQKVEGVEVREEVEMGLTDPVSIHVKIAVFKRIGVDRQLVIQQKLKRADPSSLAGLDVAVDDDFRLGKVVEGRKVSDQELGRNVDNLINTPGKLVERRAGLDLKEELSLGK